MTKYESRVNQLINSEIACYADLSRLHRDDIANNRGDIPYNYFTMSEYSIRINTLIDFAFSLDLVDNKDCFIEAINEYINGGRDICPTTDDFKLDEMEMI